MWQLSGARHLPESKSFKFCRKKNFLRKKKFDLRFPSEPSVSNFSHEPNVSEEKKTEVLHF